MQRHLPAQVPAPTYLLPTSYLAPTCLPPAYLAPTYLLPSSYLYSTALVLYLRMLTLRCAYCGTGRRVFGASRAIRRRRGATATSGTLRSYAMSGTEKAYSAIVLRACCAMCGTELAYAATRWLREVRY
eukprot:1218010-Rhodomonas_salina.1